MNQDEKEGESPQIQKPALNLNSLREAFSIFRYVKPYRGRFITGLIFIGLSAGTTMAYPYLLKLMVDSTDHYIKLPRGILLGPGSIAIIMIGVLSIQLVFSFSRIYLFSFVAEHAMADMRRDIYRKMIMMPMEFFAQRRVGELTTRISADVSQIQDMVSSSLAEMLRGILTLIIGLGLIFYISIKLTLVMLSVVPVIVIVGVVFGKRIRKLSKNTQDMLADSGTIVQETLQGISNVKSFSNEWFELSRYTRSLKKMVIQAVSAAKARGLFVGLLLFSIFSAVVLVVWFGTTLIASGELTVLDMTTFVIYTAFVGGTMAGFAELFSQLQKSLGATQRVRELLKEQTENVEIDQSPVHAEFILNGDVSLKHIAFNYPSRKEIQVLKDISIHAGKGQTIAIVGPSGAGKSTIVALLLRFYEPDAGQLLFDGRSAAEFPISEIRKQMALVPQDVLLFGGTIFENIAYGKSGASTEEVEAAARKANAHDFIMSFPEGYQTIVGERGIKLSGGQRQRIAIARAILKDPVILLLDEATSSLDSESEFLVQEALGKLMEGRTSFVIAHRLSTIRNADLIVVLEDGYIVESGTHQELVSRNEGLYKNLIRLQMEQNSVNSELS
jgi:ABC-type multidrug transport system fused ATPase/permease subunit